MPEIQVPNTLRDLDPNTTQTTKSSSKAKELNGTGQEDKENSTIGQKRKSTDAHESPANLDDIGLPDDAIIEWNANQVRSKIRQYINSGEMKVGEFQKKIGVGAGSYSNFMGQSGPTKGVQSDTFSAAAEFFKKRELAGLKMPRAKKAKTSTDNQDSSSSTKGDDKSTTKSKKEAAAQSNPHDISSVELDGDANQTVPIYDTCDDIRTKINKYMRETNGATNAGFVREINAAAFPVGSSSSNRQPASARQLTTFLNGKGPLKGCESPVFYNSYVFFEKLRLKQGKGKSQKRTEMEDVWGKQGMDCRDFTNKGLTCRADERPHVDKYGNIRFS